MKGALTGFIDHIKALPFVVDAEMEETSGRRGTLRVRTPQATKTFSIEVKREYLTRAATNAIITAAHPKGAKPPILFARYISRPTGERLAEAGIDFVDEVGNLQLKLGQRYHAFILGKPDHRGTPEIKRMGAASIQVLFAYLASQDVVSKPARELGLLAGVGKTAAAEIRLRWAADGILRPSRTGGYALADAKRLAERFVDGYERVLRPHLFLGRFRTGLSNSDELLSRLMTYQESQKRSWALGGTAGAWQLDHFFRGDETCLYLPELSREAQRELLLLPDRKGPITVLRLFSPLLVWRTEPPPPVAHPWLIYAELLHSDNPRAIEAAAELRARHLHEPAVA